MDNITKNIIYRIYMKKFGHNDNEVIAYAISNRIENYQVLLEEFKFTTSVLNYLWEITTPDKQLTESEIKSISQSYCIKNVHWIDEKNFKTLLNWLMYMCWHDGLLK